VLEAKELSKAVVVGGAGWDVEAGLSKEAHPLFAGAALTDGGGCITTTTKKGVQVKNVLDSDGWLSVHD
jgi:hypothetical protein